MKTSILLALLGAILASHLTYGVRINIAKPYEVSPTEPKLEFFNAYTQPFDPPAPVMEEPEPENLLQYQGPRVLGLQLENVVQALRYRFPDPSTTPRPNSPAARAMLPAGIPSAYARPRPPTPLPSIPLYEAPLTVGSRINPSIPNTNPDARQHNLVREQLAAQALQRQQQEALRQQQQQQIQLIQQEQQVALNQQFIQPEELYQQNQQFIQPQQELSQQFFQQDQNQQYIQPQNEFVSQDLLSSQISSPLIQQESQNYDIQQQLQSPLTQQQQQQPISGLSFSRSYHVSRASRVPASK